MKNKWTIEDYNLVKNQKLSIKSALVITTISLIAVVLIICKFKIQSYIKVQILKEEDNYFLILNPDQLDKFLDNEAIFIKNKKYKYELEEIEEYTVIEGNAYQTVHIIPHNYETKKSITDAYLLIDEKTVIERVFEFIKGEIT